MNILTLNDVAQELRCSKAFVSKLTRGLIPNTTPLPTVRVGRRVLVRREDLLEWLSQRVSCSVVRAE